jgi:hypothetical protein
MLRVSLPVELLRSRPLLLVWLTVIGQAVLWIVTPALVCGAPPGNLPLLLAVGHEWRLGSALGPPLAGWVAEAVFDVTGHSRIGLYVLSQVCVAIAYWAVFALARSIVGSRHAAISVLLLSGIFALSAFAVEFGPYVLAMPLTALALLHYWRAIGEGRTWWWVALGFDLGLLILTTYSGLTLVLSIGLFTAWHARRWLSIAAAGPFVSAMIAVVLLTPHLVWLHRAHVPMLPSRTALKAMLLGQGHLYDWIKALGSLVAFQAGLLVLTAVGSVKVGGQASAPMFERIAIDAFARRFVYFFALMPALVATTGSALTGEAMRWVAIAPLVVLSGLAAVVFAGDVIPLHRQLVLTRTWSALLVGAPLATIVALALLPWTVGIGLEVNRPPTAISRFFDETFLRRTAQPLRIVAGEAGIAGLIAMASPDRPRAFLVDRPELNVIGEDAIRRDGAVVVWRIRGNNQSVPDAIKQRFPDLAVEVPQSFRRPIQGRLPLYRIGWAMIRPAAEPPTAPP